MKYAKQEAWKLKHPWVRHIEYARRRCTDPNHKSYGSHGAKGIKVFLTSQEAKILWERDGAAQLKKPSLDRIESDKHYCIHNCRFIEHWLNSRLPHDPTLADPSWQHEEPTPAWVTENEEQGEN